MRRTFLFLVVAAVAIWGWVVVQFLQGYLGRAGAGQVGMERAYPSALTVFTNRTPLDTTFRDPFHSYLYARKPEAPIPSAGNRPKRALVVLEPPKAVLNGILWGEHPVAILKQEGATELVKEGAVTFGLKVVRIERHQVTVMKQGRKFVLEY